MQILLLVSLQNTLSNFSEEQHVCSCRKNLLNSKTFSKVLVRDIIIHFTTWAAWLIYHLRELRSHLVIQLKGTFEVADSLAKFSKEKDREKYKPWAPKPICQVYS